MTEFPERSNGELIFTIGDQLISQPARWRTFVGSVGLHLAVILLALSIEPTARVQPYKPPTVAEVLAAQDHKITWYRPQDFMPAVEPDTPRAQPTGTQPTSRFKLKQRIAANSPNPDSARQLIINGPPVVKIEKDVASANLLALSPGVDPQRFQLQQQPKTVQRTRTLPELDAPRIDATAAYEELAEMQKLERLRFRPEEDRTEKPTRAALDAPDAPEIETAAPGAYLDTLNGVDRLRYAPAGQARARPGEQVLAAGAAPQVGTSAPQGVDLSTFQQMQKLRFAGSGTETSAPSRGALTATSAAPVVARATIPGVDVATLQRVSPLRYEVGGGTQGTLDSGGRKAIADAAAGASAPDLLSAAPSTGPGGDSVGGQQIARVRYVLWGSGGDGSAPSKQAIGLVRGGSRGRPAIISGPSGPTRGSLGIAQSAALGATQPGGTLPPPPAGGGGNADRNVVVVGLDPSGQVPGDLPNGRRSAAFSGGPNQGNGDGGGGPQTARLRVPDLMIGGSPSNRAALVGSGGGTAEDLQLLASYRSASEFPTYRATTVAVDRKPEPIDPNRPFRNRRSYSLAINMPNVTSYSGSWEIQFAEIGKETEQGKLVAPTPRIKVDPRYIREAVEEEVEGEVMLHGVIRADGSIADLQIIRSVDDRLDSSALSALSKWRFDPAQKFGKAVAVEAVVRIPFRLTPVDARR